MCLTAKAIFFSARGVEAAKVTNRKPGKNLTLCITALDSKGRLRYPPVSLFFDMCLMSWLGRGVWENLVGIEFVASTVGLRAQNLHEPKMLNMENFARTNRFRRAKHKNSAPPGAARAQRASPFHGTWLVETDSSFRQSSITLGPVRRSRNGDEQKFRETFDVLIHSSGS